MNKFNVLKTYRSINKSKRRAYVLLSLILTQSKGTSIVSDQHKIDTESWFQLTLLTMMSLTYALGISCLVSHTEKGEITESPHVPMLRTLFNTRRAANVLCVSYLFCALVLETSDRTFQIKKTGSSVRKNSGSKTYATIRFLYNKNTGVLLHDSIFHLICILG